MGLFSFIGKLGGASKSAPQYNIPDYQKYGPYKPSQYDDPSSEQLYNIYSRRAAGKDVGFEKGDLRTMRAQAIDESQRVGGELERRGMAGRRFAGGVTTGGTARLREKAILSTQLARSDSLRDIAIRNAVLKRQETWQGVLGLDRFRQQERSDAYQKTAFSRQRVDQSNLVDTQKMNLEYQNTLNNYQKSMERWGLFDAFETDIYDPWMEKMQQAAAGGEGGGGEGMDFSSLLSGSTGKAKKSRTSEPYDYTAPYRDKRRSLSNYRY